MSGGGSRQHRQLTMRRLAFLGQVAGAWSAAHSDWVVRCRQRSTQPRPGACPAAIARDSRWPVAAVSVEDCAKLRP